jgi:RNA polymerase-binding transcription factor DksA
MATKTQAPAKKGKAVAAKPVTKKPVKQVKVAPKKVVEKTPAKKAVKPSKLPKVVVKKASKPAPKAKVASKKPVLVKKATKPVAKPKVKKVLKPALKKPVQAKPVAKPIVKPIEKKIAKKNTPPVKTIIKAPLKTTKSLIRPMSREEIKKPIIKGTPEKETVIKPSAPVKAKEVKVSAPKPVVIPKTSTKTIRTYQPDFTKSVLDKVVTDNSVPSQRYSDAELAEFKELIQRKLEAAKKELSYLHGLITRKDEMGGDEGDNRYMTMEDGSLSMEREQLSQMASRQITFIDHLEKAVMRIENKTYGICRVTGKLIDKARLRAVPHATLSIEAKMGTMK